MKTVVSTQFNLVNDPSRPRFKENMSDPDWFDYRKEISKKYTIPSIQNQEDQDFEKYLVIASNIENSIKRSLKATYGAYGFKSEEHTTCWYTNTHVEKQGLMQGRNEPSLSLIDQNIDDDWVLIITLASDDMMRDNTVHDMKNVEPSEGRIVMLEKGYFYEPEDGRLAEQSSGISEVDGRFYPSEAFDSLEAFNEYCEEYDFFVPAPQYSNFDDQVWLDNKGFCQVVHDKNDSTSWNKGATQARIDKWIEDEDRKRRVLNDFGIDY